MVFPARPQLSSLGPQRGPGSADWEEHGFKVGGTFPGQSWPWRERGLLPPPRGRTGRLRGAAGGGGNVQPPLHRRWLQKPGLSVVPMQTLARATLPWEEQQEKEKVAGGETEGARPAARWEREGLRGGGAERSTVCRTKKKRRKRWPAKVSVPYIWDVRRTADPARSQCGAVC